MKEKKKKVITKQTQKKKKKNNNTQIAEQTQFLDNYHIFVRKGTKPIPGFRLSKRIVSLRLFSLLLFLDMD